MTALLLSDGTVLMDSRIKQKENFVLLVEKFRALLLLWSTLTGILNRLRYQM